MKKETKKTIRVAIYTRKSTEEGLDQEFNTLHAQREACEAYVTSQRHEGWVILSETYDDGGFTGGNMDRPALKRLLRDIQDKRIDAVCVYKLDRLSRSLLDFTRIIEVFDCYDVSFTSITQAFDTSTSMGRLTLNMLLSFAQFEREVIAERTRDKMSAARRKGKWIGGRPFLGYDTTVQPGKLVVNEIEAEQVRTIYKLFLEYGTLRQTVNALRERGLTLKRWTNRKGTISGGGAFTKNSLHGLLTNRAYIGEVEFRGHICKAEYPAIVERKTFDRAQAILRANNVAGPSRHRNKYGALLIGLLRCHHCGTAMIHQYTRKGPKLYRYYVCSHAMKEGWDKCPQPSLPAGDLEAFVVSQIRRVSEDERLVEAALAEAERLRQDENRERDQQVKAYRQELERLRVDELTVEEEQRPRIAERIQEIERALDRLRKEFEADAASTPSPEILRDALQRFDPVWQKMTPQERVDLVHLLVDHVTYESKTEDVSVTFHATGLQSLALSA